MDIQLTKEALDSFNIAVSEAINKASKDGKLSQEGKEEGESLSELGEYMSNLYDEVDSAADHLVIQIVEQLVEYYPAEDSVTQ